MRRPPDLRLVTALASKGEDLTATLRAMYMGPSGRATALQTLTTRDVVMIPDLFDEAAGFVMPPDPWGDGEGQRKTIYQRLVRGVPATRHGTDTDTTHTRVAEKRTRTRTRTTCTRLVEEIHHAGQHESRTKGGGNPRFQDKCFSTDEAGLFKDDANGLFKAWHKTTAQAAGDGLRSGRDGNGHLIVNDRDDRWRQAQQRGEAPMYAAVHARIEQFFKMRIKGKR